METVKYESGNCGHLLTFTMVISSFIRSNPSMKIVQKKSICNLLIFTAFLAIVCSSFGNEAAMHNANKNLITCDMKCIYIE